MLLNGMMIVHRNDDHRQCHILWDKNICPKRRGFLKCPLVQKTQVSLRVAKGYAKDLMITLSSNYGKRFLEYSEVYFKMETMFHRCSAVTEIFQLYILIGLNMM